MLLALVLLAVAHVLFWSWVYRVRPQQDELRYAPTKDGCEIALARRAPHGQPRKHPVLRFSFLATGRHRWLVRAVSPIAGLFHPSWGQFAINTRNVDARVYRQLMNNVVEDISPGVLTQFLKWARTDVFVSEDGKVDYRGGLASAKQPALFIAGERDLLAPPASVRPGFELWGGEKEFIEANGYGHSDLIFGRHAPEEIFPLVSDWLLKRSSPMKAPAPT